MHLPHGRAAVYAGFWAGVRFIWALPGATLSVCAGAHILHQADDTRISQASRRAFWTSQSQSSVPNEPITPSGPTRARLAKSQFWRRTVCPMGPPVVRDYAASKAQAGAGRYKDHIRSQKRLCIESLPSLEPETAPCFSGKDGDCLLARPLSLGESQIWLLEVFYSHTPGFPSRLNLGSHFWLELRQQFRIGFRGTSFRDRNKILQGVNSRFRL